MVCTWHAIWGATGHWLSENDCRFVSNHLAFVVVGDTFQKELTEKKKNPFVLINVALSQRNHLHIQYPSSLSFCCLDTCNIYSHTSDALDGSNPTKSTKPSPMFSLIWQMRFGYTVQSWGCRAFVLILSRVMKSISSNTVFSALNFMFYAEK